MILSITSASETEDLLTSHEESILAALLQYIEHRTDEAKNNLIQALSLQMGVAFQIGANVAAKETGEKKPLGMDGLDPVITRIGSHLDRVFGQDSGVLTGVIKEGIRNGYAYDHVKDGLVEKLNTGWGKSVTFNSVGQVRKVVHVNPDGTMTWEKKTITQPITLSTKTYAETLSRTTQKSAYVEGHFARYEKAGYPGWVYLSVADERTRPRHLALHGHIFIVGTPQEEMAREVMREHRCRCRPKAWFGDPKLDSPPAEYAQQRADWSRQTFDDWKLDRNMPLIVQEGPQNRGQLRALAPQLKDRMDNNDWHILAHQMGLSHDDMVEDTIHTIEKNFTFIQNRKEGVSENTAAHIYQRHILGNVSKRTGEPPFTMAEVIKAKEEGILYKHSDMGGEKLKVLWESPDGRKLNVILSNRYPGKIITAFRIRQNDWDKIVKDGERHAR